ncbi:MAG: hypothetical protein JO353_13110 [Phycisphaerae bacterium]|nr:hypothetical protein [Phycisphaerae bacterium]
MHSIYYDFTGPESERRKMLYDGQLFVYSPKPSMMAFINHARKMIEEAFGDINPSKAQYSMPVEKYVEIVAPLKPKFIHHPETKKLMQALVKEYGCDLETTYIDVPRLRMVTSDGYLTSGVGFAHHPHRDTWYSAPMMQINWWVPIYDITTDMSMAFHPEYWDKKLKNGSSGFNYYEWNAVGRKDAAKMIKTDTRKQPKPEEQVKMDPQVRMILPAGAVVLFSAAHLHSTVPNNSGIARYSIDFRTVNLEDVKAKRGAPNLDSECHGTSLRDFMKGSDLSRMDEATVKQYDDVEAPEEAKIFKPELATSVK